MQSKDSSPTILVSIILLILIFAYPMGTALQNLGLLLVFILNLIVLKKNNLSPRLPPAGPMRWAAAAMLTMLCWNLLATVLNPQNHDENKIAYLIGFLPIVVMPCLAGSLPVPNSKHIKSLEKFAALCILFWGLIASSQVVWPWRWVGTQLEWGGIPRAQGFYSHPLTLAYAALLLWPYSLRRLFSQPKQWVSWTLILGSSLLLIFSMSRTSQALAAVFALINAIALFSGRNRLLVLGLICTLGLGLALTKNPVSTRFDNLLHGVSDDHFSSYPDDRLAFWDAHRLMIQERPLLGHGVHLEYEFRHPYYEKLGLGDFRKQYEAHNQYLQITTEGGFIALILFITWLIMSLKALRNPQLPLFFRQTSQQTLWIFILGGLTQNAFFDSEVRMGLIILWIFVAIAWPKNTEGLA